MFGCLFVCIVSTATHTHSQSQKHVHTHKRTRIVRAFHTPSIIKTHTHESSVYTLKYNTISFSSINSHYYFNYDGVNNIKMMLHFVHLPIRLALLLLLMMRRQQIRYDVCVKCAKPKLVS